MSSQDISRKSITKEFKIYHQRYPFRLDAEDMLRDNKRKVLSAKAICRKDENSDIDFSKVTKIYSIRMKLIDSKSCKAAFLNNHEACELSHV